MTQLGRLAVVDSVGNPGGGARFVRSLLPALRRQRPNVAITFYGNQASMERDGMSAHLDGAGVRTSALLWEPSRSWHDRPLRTRLRRKVGSWLRLPVPTPQEFVERRFAREIAAIAASSDVVFFPWPYGMHAPQVGRPMVCTIHDLNFKYWFGSPIFGSARAAELDLQIGGWLASASPVTSCEFMAAEIARFYPAAVPPTVVRLAPFTDLERTAPKARSAIVDGLLGGHTGPYVLSANNNSVHKNLGAVVAAYAVLRERYPDLLLVMAGSGTDESTGTATATGSARGIGKPDVIGLGYVPNEVVDDLIAHAAVVVNASLYEAGNGPGLDAWSLGVPVAMSDIPPFREHITAMGVSAALFDPRNPSDIAAKIADILANPARWKALAESSRDAIGKRTWSDVADGYLDAFDRAMSGR